MSLVVGQPFNPFGLFNGIYIPECLVESHDVSPGAKLLYGRLMRYAGKNGLCFPSVPTLAREIGMSERQVQRFLAELEAAELIRRVARFSDKAQRSNAFEFLWHPIFVPREDVTGGGDKMSPEGVTGLSPKDSHSEESQKETESHNLRVVAVTAPERVALSGFSQKQIPENILRPAEPQLTDDQRAVEECARHLWANHQRDRRERSSERIQEILWGIAKPRVRTPIQTTLDKIRAQHDKWRNSQMWRDGKAHGIRRWLTEGLWEDDPEPPNGKAPNEPGEKPKREPVRIYPKFE